MSTDVNRPNIDIVSTVISEYGQALRGDWGSIDGRTCRDQLDSIAAALDSDTPTDLRELRDDSGICSHGGGHWTMYCSTDCETEYAG